MKSAYDIEKEFNMFFEKINFQRIDKMVGFSPDFKNADYIEPDRKIVVELKVLDKDFFDEGGIIERFHSFIPKAIKVDEKGLGLYSLKLPAINREGKYDTLEEPLRRILKKANRQIRETKERQLDGIGLGMLVLALNNFRSLRIDILACLVGELLLEEFSSIAGFVICTPCWTNAICISGAKDKSPETVHKIRFEIAEKWSEFFDNGGHS
jgi:hypothetical protein